MLIDFFFFLREQGIKVSIAEWLTLLEGMKKGLHHSTLYGFLVLSRAIIIRNESDYDKYDVAFYEFFKNLPDKSVLPEELLKAEKEEAEQIAAEIRKRKEMNGLEDKPEDEGEFVPQQQERMDIPLDMEGFGTAGKISGIGLQMPGAGPAGGRTSIIAPGSRKFRDFRKDNQLDTRQFQMAFRLLRNLTNQSNSSELEFDIDKTIDRTAQMGGLLHVEYRKPRRNNIRVLLFIDSGGSMEGYASLCSELFQAASASKHLKELRTYYFHNCIYSAISKEPTLAEKDGISLEQLMAECDDKYRVIIVGDAEMNPAELMSAEYNWIDEKAGEPGFTCLQHLKAHFPHTIWLNPDRGRHLECHPFPDRRADRHVRPDHPGPGRRLPLPVVR